MLGEGDHVGREQRRATRARRRPQSPTRTTGAPSVTPSRRWAGAAVPCGEKRDADEEWSQEGVAHELHDRGRLAGMIGVREAGRDHLRRVVDAEARPRSQSACLRARVRFRVEGRAAPPQCRRTVTGGDGEALTPSRRARTIGATAHDRGVARRSRSPSASRTPSRRGRARRRARARATPSPTARAATTSASVSSPRLRTWSAEMRRPMSMIATGSATFTTRPATCRRCLDEKDPLRRDPPRGPLSRQGSPPAGRSLPARGRAGRP